MTTAISPHIAPDGAVVCLPAMGFGEWVKAERVRQGLSKAALADAAGVGWDTIHEIEERPDRQPNARTWRGIVRALGSEPPKEPPRGGGRFVLTLESLEEADEILIKTPPGLSVSVDEDGITLRRKQT